MTNIFERFIFLNTPKQTESLEELFRARNPDFMEGTQLRLFSSAVQASAIVKARSPSGIARATGYAKALDVTTGNILPYTDFEIISGGVTSNSLLSTYSPPDDVPDISKIPVADKTDRGVFSAANLLVLQTSFGSVIKYDFNASPSPKGTSMVERFGEEGALELARLIAGNPDQAAVWRFNDAQTRAGLDTRRIVEFGGDVTKAAAATRGHPDAWMSNGYNFEE